jgi:PhzF family phenazine biosynthesis protein
MKIPIYQVDAFTDRLFGGNPAAVCPLEAWLADEVMQKIALENALAETAFFVRAGDEFEIRWFTPEIEMDLCGHATLAAAHVIVRHLKVPLQIVRFASPSGPLTVTVEDGLLTLDFPSRPPQRTLDVPREILEAIRVEPRETLKSRDYVLVYESEDVIRRIQPDQGLMNQINIDPGGVIVTAPGHDVDFVSRYFTPQASIFEDPVTGSAHCSLIPYWSGRLGKQSMIALQLSPRLGRLYCRESGERVLIAGEAVTYMEGQISV